MTEGHRDRPSLTSAFPPELEEIDSIWDDELPPASKAESSADAFDRPTTIPEVPLEVAAARMMDAVDPFDASSSCVPAVPPKFELELDDLDTPPPTSRGPARAIAPAPRPPAPAVAGSVPQFPAAPPPLTEQRPPQRRALTEGALPIQGAPVGPAGAKPFPGVVPVAPQAPYASEGDPFAEPLPLNSLRPFEVHAPEPESPLALADRQSWRQRRPSRPPPSLQLELADSSPNLRALSPRSAEDELSARQAMGDFSGALKLAEALLADQPSHAQAQRIAEECRDKLLHMYMARIGDLELVPRVAIRPEEVRWLSMDHRAGFLLSLVDGTSSFEEILDISGMQRLDALRILHMLLEQRVISLI